MSIITTKDQITEKANFIQHYIPGLESGDYLITAHNQIYEKSGKKLNSSEVEIEPLSYKFAVKGPRYSLQPGVVHSVFPAANSVGQYETVIPHAVLTQKSLPWQRSPEKDPDLSGEFSYKGNGGKPITYDQNVASWLAVLLLNEDDFNWDNPAKLTFKDAFQKGSVADLLPPKVDKSHAVSTLSLQRIGSDGTGLEVGEQTTDPCLYVQMPIEVFNFLAPSVEDLKMMANVRQVAVSNKPTDSMTKVEIEQITAQGGSTTDMGTYSIVLGNRLPAAGKKHLSVLVSLEGMEDYLPGAAAPKSFPTGTTSIRLPVLKQWTFNSQTEKYSFDGLFEGLNGGKPGASTLNQPQLQFYPSKLESLNTATQKALQFGYVPMNHRTRANDAVGKQTASWYRGPLAPVETQTGIVKPTDKGTMLIYHADNLLRQNPDTGLFDVSYAAAWQLGQLLALQDKTFSTLIYQWKQETLSGLIQAIDQYLITQNTSTIKNLQDGATDDDLNADFYEGIIHLLKKMAVQS